MENISSLSELNKLETLYIEKCKLLGGFGFLTGNKTIKNLFLSEVDSLDFIPTMKSIKNLKFWELKDGNLTYLLNSPSLEKVEFYPQKKHYTHKKEEINSLINK